MAILYPTSLDTDNTLYELTNNAKTYLNGALDTSGGNNGQSATIDVVTGSVFPTTAGFFLIGTELFKSGRAAIYFKTECVKCGEELVFEEPNVLYETTVCAPSRARAVSS